MLTQVCWQVLVASELHSLMSSAKEGSLLHSPLTIFNLTITGLAIIVKSVSCATVAGVATKCVLAAMGTCVGSQHTFISVYVEGQYNGVNAH